LRAFAARIQRHTAPMWLCVVMSEHIRKTRSIRAKGTGRCAAVPLIEGTRPPCVIGVRSRRVQPAYFRSLSRGTDPTWIPFEITMPAVAGHLPRSDLRWEKYLVSIGLAS
jgi:hypothetical protein